MTIYQNLIAGEWVGSEASNNISPSDINDVVGSYAQGTADDAKQAIAAAKAAFPAWSRSGIMERHAILRKAADEIVARKDELGTLLAREEGKTLPEAIGETLRAAQIFDFFAGEALRLTGEVVPSARPGIGVEITREPLGVIGIITPWNFPIAIPAWKIAPALCYGNTVVFKPADLVPGCAWAIVDILHRAGLPKGVLNLVMGRGSVVGQAMLDSPDLAGITFTGSTGTGKRVALASIEHNRKFQLEMGGKNPMVVLDDADLNVAVEASANSGFFSTGQRCTASSRIIVTEGIHDKFVAALTERLKGLTVDNALKQGTHIGPVVDEKQLKQDMDYIALGQQEGAKLAFGGERIERDTPGFYLQPTLFTEATNQMRISREEIFGPVASVIRVKDYDEALAVANDTPFGLSAGIATTSLKYATHFKRNSEAGMVMVNLPTAGVDFHVPFGGRKASSFGPREQGKYAAEFFTVVKTAYTLP
ncbi:MULTISPECIES: aldehyde dehydrogenase family protein [Pseudorhizobium]|uniref:Aldehyde dehydrogenase n=1 Tax=Pseudorhizobium pelagicum TaxID=1509405 RepID=A0A922P470_9HYPH|nr:MULTISPECIES: aldehyde dehydrogenase family protein [Pseudorhizobium]MBU1316051.1 aldehyde dehydrogenase family protein [Alphaproteobacteria bacterium]KEQ07468.1 aldehyde dehydrogenase [Pseudorhizobium pelagicum]KEQ09064.1 aldehyde dehydrogenase [Pseudorhizobium pelagicum]MBU1549800.1 aldehyde dehydrogenase family protein [Alphaproteobacteria bacterium]MBU2336745.1 aldehyde dehydrogenase family protein [Alphaproteobacteria bacterium]|tara:strand:+ start:4984 stop:6417 length:1434 start_codon:yes stop_codon:yes gene_type:complete